MKRLAKRAFEMESARPARSVESYFLRFFFGFDFFKCGAGGVASIRRSTSSSLGCGARLCLRDSLMCVKG